MYPLFTQPNFTSSHRCHLFGTGGNPEKQMQQVFAEGVLAFSKSSSLQKEAPLFCFSEACVPRVLKSSKA
jgi:hypothetical protein